MDENNYSFQRYMTQCFVVKPIIEPNPKKASIAPTLSQTVLSAPIPSSNIPIVPFQLSKEFLAKLKQSKLLTEMLYAQASKLNVKDIIHIKDAFPSLSLKKIVEFNNILNISKSVKSCIKITTKKPLRKQIIILMDQSNTSFIVNHANTFIRNINNHFCKHNLNIIANFIRLEDHRVIITTN